MAIDQVKTINELERLPQVEDSNAFAASTDGATGSVTANQIMEYLKQYLESLSNKSTTITQSNDQYPTCNAVSSEITRITNIMSNKTPGYPNWAGISKPVNTTVVMDGAGLIFVESTNNNHTGRITINGYEMIYGSGNGYAKDYYCATFFVDNGTSVKTDDTVGRLILFKFYGKN